MGAGVRDGLTVWGHPRSTLREPQGERPCPKATTRDCPYGGMDSGSGAGMSGVTGVRIWGAIPESPLREGMGSRIGARDSWGKGERQGRCMEGVRSYNGKSDNVI